MKKSERLYYLDFLRVICMFLVIIIHVANVYVRYFPVINESSFFTSLVFNAYSRVSVPIFLMISGSLMFNRTFDKEKYFLRLKRFILILFFWNVFYLLWEYLYYGITYDKLYRLLWDPYRAHLWYLYATILLTFIQPILKVINDNISNKIKYILLILFIFITVYCLFSFKFAYYTTYPYYICMFVFGYYLTEFIEKNKAFLFKYKWIILALFIIIIIPSFILNYYKSLSLNSYYREYYNYKTIFITLGSILLFIFLAVLQKNWYSNKIISSLSGYSLGVYLIHGIYLDILKSLFNWNKLNPIWSIPCFGIIILFFSIVSVALIKKIKLLNKFL